MNILSIGGENNYVLIITAQSDFIAGNEQHIIALQAEKDWNALGLTFSDLQDIEVETMRVGELRPITQYKGAYIMKVS